MKSLENETLSVDTYVKEYMDVVTPFHTDIAQKNNNLFFGENELNFLRELDFRNLRTKDLSDSTRENVEIFTNSFF